MARRTDEADCEVDERSEQFVGRAARIARRMNKVDSEANDEVDDEAGRRRGQWGRTLKTMGDSGCNGGLGYVTVR